MADNIKDFESIMDSMLKCQRGVRWKPSVKHYIIGGVEEAYRQSQALQNGSWKNSKPNPITIPYPKRRAGLSIPFKDRVYQRSINDNVLYPAMTKSFIAANCACQKGKGTDYARKLVKKYLWRHFRNHGLTGWVLQIDIKSYYPTMRHDAVYTAFKPKLDSEVYASIKDILEKQSGEEAGFFPGSQMVQIAGISLLDKIDHHIKERCRIRSYIRYMDDFLLIHESKETLENCLEEIKAELAKIGFKVHPKKTKIRPLKDGFRFLGFDYKLTETGKVLMMLDSDNIKHERRKLRRMAKKVLGGEMDKAKADECYRSWKAHAAHGTSYKLLQRMDTFYNSLFKEVTA